MTELLVLQTDSFDSIYMFNSMLWLFWTLRYVASMFDKGQEANGMCACTLLESLCLASPFAVESCGQISVGVGIG